MIYLTREGQILKMIKKIQLDWWRLRCSPTKANESLLLELSWAWEPTGRIRAW